MANIKIREINKNTIRTLDRTAAMTHHIKDMTVRTRERTDISERYENEQLSSYASNQMIQSGNRATSRVIRTGSDAAKAAWRTQGKKLIQDREASHLMERSSGSGSVYTKIDRFIGTRSDLLSKTGSVRHPDHRVISSPAFPDTAIKRYEKEKAVAMRRFQMARRADSMVRSAREAAYRMKRSLRRALANSRLRSLSLSAGGAAALLIIVTFVFFGGAFSYFSSAPAGVDEDLLLEYGLFGIGVGDDAIVRVAARQVGNVGGRKFWRWYGFNSRVDWCCIFVSWCADQCGYIDSGTIPRFSVVSDGVSWFKGKGQWKGRSYSPSPGDLIFFTWEKDALSHVGIVERCDSKTVYTIEGNSGDACKRQSYSVNASCIVGYGVPSYPTSAGGHGAEKALAWAVMIANDDSFSYGPRPYANRCGCYFCGTQGGKLKAAKGTKWEGDPRWNKTYVCLTFVGAAYAHGAKDPEILAACKRNNLTMYSNDNNFTKFHCWRKVGACKDLTIRDLRPGDVVIKYDTTNGSNGAHAWMYAGGDNIVEATAEGWSADAIAVKPGAAKRLEKYGSNSRNYVMRYVGSGRS